MADATGTIKALIEAQQQAYADFMAEINPTLIEKNVSQQGMGKI